MKKYTTIMSRYFIYILFCIAFAPFYATAQQNDDNAFAGKNAVFLYHAFQAASPAYPDPDGNTGFILQRHEKGATAGWITIREFHSPQNAGELLENYKRGKKMFSGDIHRFDAGEAWTKWKKYKTFDSLATELSYLTGQMAFGILVADTTVQTGKTYLYRIFKNKQPVPAGDAMASNWVSYPAVLTQKSPKFLHRHTEADAIMIDWFVRDHTGQNMFNVYRATGDEKEFRLIKPNMVSAVRNDSLIYSIQDTYVAFDKLYRYYIAPVNPFGGGGNVHSDTISATCMNPQQLLTAQHILARGDLKQRAILLHYMLPNPEYIGSVHIMRSTNYDKNYEEIGVNPPNDSVYTDHRITPGIKYYYYLVMTDKLGRNSARSIKAFGLFQEGENLYPARYVKALPVKGGVQITWLNPPAKELISGYYVCRSFGRDNGFQRITTLLPVMDSINTYIDTSHNLQAGNNYAYTVLSENLSNKVSKNSVIAYAAPGETKVPVAFQTPKNFRAMAENKSVRLLWYDMRIVNRTQAYYNIYRKSNIDTSYKTVTSNYPAGFTSYRDTTTLPGVNYTYALECADANGHKSAMAVSAVNMAGKAIIAPAISVFASKNGAIVAWERSAEKLTKEYIIYRYKKGDEPVKIGQAKVADTKFEDKDLVTGNTYYYFIKPYTENKQAEVRESNRVYLVY